MSSNPRRLTLTPLSLAVVMLIPTAVALTITVPQGLALDDAPTPETYREAVDNFTRWCIFSLIALFAWFYLVLTHIRVIERHDDPQ